MNRTIRCFALIGGIALGGAGAADGISGTVSGPFAVSYLAVGAGLPLLRDGVSGRERSWRVVDTLLTTFALTECLKGSVLERRPDGSDRSSFPSAHASVTFAVATMQAQFHPNEALYWYGGSALVAAARVDERKHYVHDVLAGAALGYLVARVELSLPRGLLLQPLIGQHGETGLMFSCRF